MAMADVKESEFEQMDVLYDMETADCDDLFAVLLLEAHPKVQLRAITITPGSRNQIAAITNLFRNKLGNKSVVIGGGKPNYPKDCICYSKNSIWRHICGDISAYQPNTTNANQDANKDVNSNTSHLEINKAVDVYGQTLKLFPNLVIITGAPLTNLYTFLNTKRSGINSNINIKKLVIQGGFAGDNIVPKKDRLKKFDGKIFCSTFNFNGNPKAAQFILQDTPNCMKNGFKFDERILVSKNVCHGVIYTQKMHSMLRAIVYGNNNNNISPALKLIYQGMNFWWTKPRNRKTYGKKFHDPLAVCVAIYGSKICNLSQIIPVSKKVDKWGLQWGSQLSNNSNIFIVTNCNTSNFFRCLSCQSMQSEMNKEDTAIDMYNDSASTESSIINVKKKSDENNIFKEKPKQPEQVGSSNKNAKVELSGKKNIGYTLPFW